MLWCRNFQRPLLAVSGRSNLWIFSHPNDRFCLNEESGGVSRDQPELLDLDRALTRLEQIDPRQARIVELRVFGGFEVQEVGALLEISPATVKRDWTIAKAWLHRELHH